MNIPITKKQQIYYLTTIINKVIDDLKVGKKPAWQKPWGTNPSACLSFNMTSDEDKYYTGINQAFLPSGGYITLLQAKKHKLRIKKEEFKKPYILYLSTPKFEENEDGEDEIKYWYVKFHQVYHFDQLEDDAQKEALKKFPRLTIKEDKVNTVELDEKLKEVDDQISLYLRTLNSSKFAGNRAYYNLTNDHLQMPPAKAFKNPVAFYSTLLHECAHSTGNETRLKRTFGFFGDIDYAYEELVAELASSLLCKELGLDYVGGHIEAEQNTKEYLLSWLSKLNNNIEQINNAGQDALKAAKFITTIIFGKE